MGKIGIRTYEVANTAGVVPTPTMWAPRANTFTLTRASEKQEARAWLTNECGPQQLVDSVVTQETWTLRVGIQSFDPTDISFTFNEKSRESTAVVFPEVSSVVVPAGGIVSAPGMAADPKAAAVVIDPKAGAKRVLISGDDFTVGVNQLTFDVEFIGLAVAYMYDRTFANAQTIGLGANPDDWGDVCFSGVACGPRFPQPMQIFVPAMSQSNNFELSFQDQTSVELEFTPKIVQPFRSTVLIKF